MTSTQERLRVVAEHSPHGGLLEEAASKLDGLTEVLTDDALERFLADFDPPYISGPEEEAAWRLAGYLRAARRRLGVAEPTTSAHPATPVSDSPQGQ